MTDRAGAHVVRQSPSGRLLGSLGFARLSLSAVAPYVDGVEMQIPFDVIDDMSPGFGELVTGGVLGQPGAFRVASTGVYLVVTFVTAGNVPTDLILVMFAGASPMGDGITTTDGISVPGNGIITSLLGTDGDICSAVKVDGGSGDLQVEGTSCLIVQVG